MIEGMRSSSGIKVGDDGQPEAMVLIAFGDDIGLVELTPSDAAEFGAQLISNARGSADLLGFVQALETIGQDEDTIRQTVELFTGVAQEPQPPSKQLDVVTDPTVVRNLNR